jgi:HAE1 family hydrophobic/amphiphilic exporter-1
VSPGDRTDVVSEFVTSRPVAILMVFLAAVVFGFFSYGRLPVTLMPELSYPTLTVRTEYPGAAPEEVENDVSRPVEETLGVIGGLRRISSISRAGLSDVVLEFSWDTEMADAIQDTIEKLDQVFLPEEAERPLILRFDPSLDPVLELSLSGSGERFEGEEGLRRLRRIAELQVKRQLEPIKGVAAARVRGGLEEQIHVRLDEERVRQTGLSARAVIRRLAEENINVAGGTITEGRTEYMVRTLNEYANLEQIRETVVAIVDGREVRIGDLAEVARGHKDREMITRTDGAESVQIDVYKEADTNIVALAERVKDRVGEPPGDDGSGAAQETGRGWRQGREGPERAPTLAAELHQAEGLDLRLVADRSVFIASSVNEVRNTAIIGGVLAIIVLFAFLRQIRPTAIVAVSIPISLLITFAPLNLLGVSLNIMSLGGLALGIGMLVDSSIVVLESISRCREEGDGVVAAAIRGTREVRTAVVASTLTSIAVFLPMVFVEGIAGQAFGDLGLAVVISLLASLVVALLFIPMLASRRGLDLAEGSGMGVRVRWWAWRSVREQAARVRPLVWPLAGPYLLVYLVLGTLLELLGTFLLGLLGGVLLIWRRWLGGAVGAVFEGLTGPLLAVVAGALKRIHTVYERTLRTALRYPLPVVVLTAAALAFTWQLAQSLDTELLPEVHQGEFTFEVALPVGTPLQRTAEVLSPVEEAILAEKGEIQSLLLTLGYDPTNTRRSDEGEHTARFKVLLDSSDPAAEQRVIARLRQRLEAIPDLNARVSRPVLFSFRTPIEVEVHGDDLGRLKDMADRVESVMASLPALADVEGTLRTGAPEVQIVYDRERLMRADLNLAEVAELVRAAVKGDEATRFNMQDRRIPIVVRYEESDRESVMDVRELVVNPEGDRPVPLHAIADVELAEGPSEVRRIDGRRVALVRANLGDASLGSAVAAIEREVGDRIEWPADMTFFVTGQSEEWERSQGSLLLALGLSVFLVYVIMAAQFESLLHPLVIMFTIPLAFLGTMLALWALGISLSIVVFLGMIMLAGIVVNNAIVLVDYINTLRGRGLPPVEAIITAGTVRLRPILMTTATTALGLTPMALGFGDGAEIRTPMAIAVISGLIVSTVLTLVVVPVVYAVLDRAVAVVVPSRQLADAVEEG